MNNLLSDTKRLTVSLLSLLFCLTISAANYPHNSDMLWVTVPDHADWLYKTGEKATIEVQLYRYGIPCDGVTVEYGIGGDMMPDDTKGSIVLKNGRGKISIGTMKEPGFRDLRLTAVIDGNKSQHHVKVGFSPEKIQPYTKMPKDFKEFWEANKKELESVPLKYEKTLAPEYCTEKIDCYLIKLYINNRNQCVYGYLTCPKNLKKGGHPVVFCPPGAGVKTIKEPLKRKYYAESGCIRLEMEIHGLDPRMPEDKFKEISNAFNTKENGYLQMGLDNRDNYYMKRVYLACVRAIDFLTSLPEWDGKNVIAQGGSQGGALALITAGLDSRVTLCVANHPALSDMAGYMANRAGGYPHMNRLNGMFTPDKLKTLQYYDVVNFARCINIPTYLTWGYNDNTCPPTTSYAVYNLLPEPKDALITPINEHWTTNSTEHSQLKWVQKHLK